MLAQVEPMSLPNQSPGLAACNSLGSWGCGQVCTLVSHCSGVSSAEVLHMRVEKELSPWSNNWSVISKKARNMVRKTMCLPGQGGPESTMAPAGFYVFSLIRHLRFHTHFLEFLPAHRAVHSLNYRVLWRNITLEDRREDISGQGGVEFLSQCVWSVFCNLSRKHPETFGEFKREEDRSLDLSHPVLSSENTEAATFKFSIV